MGCSLRPLFLGESCSPGRGGTRTPRHGQSTSKGPGWVWGRLGPVLWMERKGKIALAPGRHAAFGGHVYAPAGDVTPAHTQAHTCTQASSCRHTRAHRHTHALQSVVLPRKQTFSGQSPHGPRPPTFPPLPVLIYRSQDGSPQSVKKPRLPACPHRLRFLARKVQVGVRCLPFPL